MRKKNSHKTVMFRNLEQGDAFLVGDEIFMKMEEIIDRDGDTWNAVSVETGEKCCCPDNYKAKYIDVLMTIREDKNEQ